MCLFFSHTSSRDILGCRLLTFSLLFSFDSKLLPPWMNEYLSHKMSSWVFPKRTVYDEFGDVSEVVINEVGAKKSNENDKIKKGEGKSTKNIR